MYDYRIYGPGECPEDLFRFRYEVYIEELQRKQSYACEKTRTIKDPLDEAAHHAVVRKDGEIIACVRLNIAGEGDISPYFRFYDMHHLPPVEQPTASICTLDMVARPYRKTMVFVRMMQLMFDFIIRRELTSCYMDVNDHLIELFHKLGFEKVATKHHPDYGDVTIMRFHELDYEQLKAARSPLAPIYKRYLDEQAIAGSA